MDNPNVVPAPFPNARGPVLFRHILEAIIAEPARWNQSIGPDRSCTNYQCGSAWCIAGWAISLTGTYNHETMYWLSWEADVNQIETAADLLGIPVEGASDRWYDQPLFTYEHDAQSLITVARSLKLLSDTPADIALADAFIAAVSIK